LVRRVDLQVLRPAAAAILGSALLRILAQMLQPRAVPVRQMAGKPPTQAGLPHRALGL
jgi:hypothetical protein